MSLMLRMKLLWMKLMLRNVGARAPAFDDLEGMGRRLACSPSKSGAWRKVSSVEPEARSQIECTVMTIESLR